MAADSIAICHRSSNDNKPVVQCNEIFMAIIISVYCNVKVKFHGKFKHFYK